MRKVFLTLYLSIISLTCFAADTFVVFTPEPHHFPLITKGAPCSIVMDTAEDEGVKMAISNLQQDIRQVCNNQPALLNNIPAKRCVIIGNYHSAIIQKLIAAGKIDKEQLINKNEKFLLQVIAKPADGVDEALVIAGSDKRGTIYGIYELSKQMGVSPWYWRADVPVIQQENVYIKPGIYTDGEP